MDVHPVRIGLKAAGQHATIEALQAVWRIADERGFDHCWAFDHFAPIFSDVHGDVFEGWTMLAGMAALTSRTRVGLMVTGNTYRHPGVLAKMAVTVDHLSAGRLEFGLGAAWAEDEHSMFGLEFGTVGQRIARLKEALQVVRSLWTEPQTDFEGTYYHLKGAVSNPKPVQRPFPPIWVGGGGERKTLRVVAELADVWNLVGGAADDAARKSKILDQHCIDVGRDPGSIRRSMQVYFRSTDPGSAVELAASYLEAGFTELIIGVGGEDIVREASVVADEVMPAIRELAQKGNFT